MLTVEKLENLYAQSDALADAGDRAGAELTYRDAVAQVELSAVLPVGASPLAISQRLDLAAYLAQAPELKAAITAAIALDPFGRLIALRRVLSLQWPDDDRIPVGAAGRAVAALARPRALDIRV